MFLNKSYSQKPGTGCISIYKGKNAAWRIQDSQFKELTKDSDFQWEHKKTDLENLLTEPLISKSFKLKNFFASNSIQNSTETIKKSISTAHNMPRNQVFTSPLSNKGIYKSFHNVDLDNPKAPAKASNINTEIINSTSPAEFIWPLEDTNKTRIFKVFCKIKKLQKKNNKKINDEPYIIPNHDPLFKRMAKSTIPAQRYLKSAFKNEIFIKDLSNVNFPIKPITYQHIKKNESTDNIRFKSFSQFKNLPLYRLSVENNMLLKLKNSKGRLR